MPSEPQKDDGSQGVGQAHISYVVVLLAGGVSVGDGSRERYRRCIH